MRINRIYGSAVKAIYLITMGDRRSGSVVRGSLKWVHGYARFLGEEPLEVTEKTLAYRWEILMQKQSLLIAIAV